MSEKISINAYRTQVRFDHGIRLLMDHLDTQKNPCMQSKLKLKRWLKMRKAYLWFNNG